MGAPETRPPVSTSGAVGTEDSGAAGTEGSGVAGTDRARSGARRWAPLGLAVLAVLVATLWPFAFLTDRAAIEARWQAVEWVWLCS